jgi:hypothetical protein
MRKSFLLILLWLMLVAPLFAQQMAMPPPEIEDALNDLSQRLGVPLTLRSFDSWRWSEEFFENTGMGCPPAGEVVANTPTRGFQFLFTYQGITYDYRVAKDAERVNLCQDTLSPQPEAPPIDGYSNLLCPPVAEGALPYMRSRVAIGVQARITTSVPNNLRADPGINGAQIGQLGDAAIFDIIGGPACVDGLVWWQIQENGRTGWTAEGLEGIYYLEPLPGARLPGRQPIKPENANRLQFMAQVQGNFLPQPAWLKTNDILVLPGDVGSESLWLYTADLLHEPPRFVPQDEPLKSLAVFPAGDTAIVGTADGGAHFWYIRTGVTPVETLFFQTHERDTVVAINLDGTKFASAGVNAISGALDDKRFGILLWDVLTVAQDGMLVGHTAPVIQLAYSPDKSLIASVDTTGTAIIQSVTNATLPALVRLDNAGVRAVAFSPNNQFLAVAKANGTIDVLDPLSGIRITTLTGYLGGVNAVAFSPDNALLAGVSDDGTLRLWNTQSDTNVAVVEVGNAAIKGVAFNAAGTLIVTVGNHTARFFGVPLDS